MTRVNMTCESCKKEAKQLRADWQLPPKERKWQCDKCYWNKSVKYKKYGTNAEKM